jgi:precorrin-2 dehydrogenase/sirohydrochlorin ferrochelatase
MGWTPLFLKMDKKKVLIVGSGEVGERRANTFLGAGAEVIITGGTVSEELKKQGVREKPLQEIENLVKESDLVVIASGDQKLNDKVASLISENSVSDNSELFTPLLNRADNPFDGDVIVPTSFFIGDIQVSIFTGGKSPLMARSLRKKIQSMIDEKDILRIELQYYARNLLREFTTDQKKRREYLYQIFNDPEVDLLLEKGELEEAKRYVNSFLDDTPEQINPKKNRLEKNISDVNISNGNREGSS